jgi:hypothetical protein
MRRVFGQLIWTQSRDIRVLNYPRAMVYEIWTNQGYLRIGHDKETNAVFKVDECIGSKLGSEIFKSECHKDQEVFFPSLK